MENKLFNPDEKLSQLRREQKEQEEQKEQSR
jgi:hypothetical protein